MSRLFVSHGQSALIVVMAGPSGHSWKSRPQRRASDDPHWRTLPVEGSAQWRRQTAPDRRAKRNKLLLMLLLAVVICGAAGAIVH